MAFPVTKGSNAETQTILKDQWTLVASAVAIAKITNLSKNKPTIFFHHTLAGDPAPTDLSVVKDTLYPDYDNFDGAGVDRNLYLYPVDEDVEIRMEA